MPRTLDEAVALMGSLVQDPRLVLGLQTVAVILVVSGALTALLLSAWTRR